MGAAWRDLGHGRVAGRYYEGGPSNGRMLIIFNQWRSGASSILSRYTAELVLRTNTYEGVLFLDRIGSGGASDNTLTLEELKAVKNDGEKVFAKTYADAISSLMRKENLPKRILLGGSSAGSLAAFATAMELGADKAERVILIEPAGLRQHGIKGRAAVAHALTRHVAAYRHRVRRGWWTPMDREQYFAKGKMFEYRAKYWASDRFRKDLEASLAAPGATPIMLILSRNSHISNERARDKLLTVAAPPHQIRLINGNHDTICQPPSLSRLYASAGSGSRNSPEQSNSLA